LPRQLGIAPERDDCYCGSERAIDVVMPEAAVILVRIAWHRVASWHRVAWAINEEDIYAVHYLIELE
jgi:hypothetical protein